jgi:hypothetical protein
MIECTDLFVDAEWACAHLQGDQMRVNIQLKGTNKIILVHIRIDSIANFLDQCRRAQNKARSVAIDTSDSKAF